MSRPIVIVKVTPIHWLDLPKVSGEKVSDLANHLKAAAEEFLAGTDAIPPAQQGEAVLVSATVRFGVINVREYFGQDMSDTTGK